MRRHFVSIEEEEEEEDEEVEMSKASITIYLAANRHQRSIRKGAVLCWRLSRFGHIARDSGVSALRYRGRKQPPRWHSASAVGHRAIKHGGWAGPVRDIAGRGRPEESLGELRCQMLKRSGGQIRFPGDRRMSRRRSARHRGSHVRCEFLGALENIWPRWRQFPRIRTYKLRPSRHAFGLHPSSSCPTHNGQKAH